MSEVSPLSEATEQIARQVWSLAFSLELYVMLRDPDREQEANSMIIELWHYAKRGSC